MTPEQTNIVETLYFYVEHSPQLRAGLKKLAEDLESTQAELEKARVDAGRYRKLRLCDWFSSPLAVVRNPKKVLTGGSALGCDCPSHARLDEAVDALPEQTT